MSPKGEAWGPLVGSRGNAGVRSSGEEDFYLPGRVAMSRTPAIGAFVAIGITAALLTGPPAATADELADLRANQERCGKGETGKSARGR